MAIEYIQRWLEEAKAKTSIIGWFKPKTYEILKSQKGLDIPEPVIAENIYIVTDSESDTNSSKPFEVRFFPKITTEVGFTITISDEDICSYNLESNTLEYKDKGGIVDIIVTATNGGATSTKQIVVNKPSTSINIKEGNYAIKGVDKLLTFEILPSDSTETINDVFIFNNPEISLTNGEVDNTYNLLSNTIGMYYAKVITSKNSFKVPVHIIESESQVVESINVEGIKDAYKFNEEIQIYPSFLPETATKKDFYIIIDNPEIAVYNKALNTIKTGITEGTTRVSLYSVVGNASTSFNLVVNESGIKPVPDIESISLVGIPDVLEVGNTYPFTYEVSPPDADITKVEISFTGTGISITNNTTINALSNGSATIKANDTSNTAIKATKDVEVITKVSSLEFGVYEKNILSDGSKHDLAITISPETASNKTLEITSTGVIKLDADKKYYADTVGTGKITAKTTDGTNITISTDTITVTAPVVKVSSIDITGIPSSVNTGEEIPFSVDVLPTNATDKTYTITNSANITVSDNKFIANNPLENSFITATSNDGSGTSKTINFTVINPIVLVNDFEITGLPTEVTVGATVNDILITAIPSNATDKTFTIRSSENIDILDNTSFRAVTTGQGTITVTANDTGKYEETFTFNIVDV